MDQNEDDVLELVIPLPMPTWNRILAMHYWERKQLRDAIHDCVIKTAKGEKLCELDRLRYLALVRPSKKNKQAAKCVGSASKKKH